MPNGGSDRERDPYSQRPIDDQWVMVWLNPNWLHLHESIEFDHGDLISYNGGPHHGQVEFIDSPHFGNEYFLLTFSKFYGVRAEETLKFRKIAGTNNWLHLDRQDWNNNCMLMPSEFQGQDDSGCRTRPEMHPSNYG